MDKMTDLIAQVQALAQAGLYYGKDKFDLERYERLREISAEMLALKTDTDIEDIKTLFCNDYGYQTPKVDTRAIVFKDDKILLIQESDGRWAPPGGWCEYNMSPVDNVKKEAMEEAGREVEVESLIAIQSRNSHSNPKYVYEVVKIFYLCRELGGEFKPNIETLAADYFAEDNLPEIAENKTSTQQIKMCFEANRTKNWKVKFD